MRRTVLAGLFSLLVASPAAALPTADEVKANVRKAVGFDAFQKLEHGLDLDGKAEFFGLPGTFTLRLHPDGRYARVITAAGTHAVGFDGTTRWGRNFAEPALDLHFEEADRDSFLFGVLCHRWLAAGGGFTVAVDEGTSRTYKLDLVLSHPDAGVSARLALDAATWLPETLHIPSGHRGRVFDFADYRAVAGVTVPTKIGHNRYEGGQWIAAERAGPAAAGPTPFARPAVPRRAVFDPAVPAKLEARKGPGGMVLVRPAVDGKALPWFVLDTGNGAQTVITAALADRLGLAASGGMTAYGVGAGEVRSKFRTAGRFTLGPATVPNPTFGDCPDALGRAFSESAGIEIGGFIGQAFLSQVVIELDPVAGAAAVHDPATYQFPPGGAWEPLRLNGRAPCVRASFDGKHAGWYTFDSGFEAPLVFNLEAVIREKILDGQQTTPHALVGVGGEEAVRMGAGGEFRVFGRTTRTARTLYAIVPNGGHTDPYTLGTFGPSALGPGTLVLDYPNARIGFVPRP